MSILQSERLRFLSALRFHRFTLLWLGQTISRIGDGAYITALAWQVLLLTGSGTAMGLVLLASSLPQVLFLLVGGVVADRLPRQLVLLVSDIVRAVVVLIIALLSWLQLLQLWHLIGASLIFGLASGFFFPAYQAMPPELVEKETLGSANALGALSRQFGQLVGPLLGAAIVALVGPASAFAFDGASFIASALCIISMRFVSQPTIALAASEERVDVQPRPATRMEAVSASLRSALRDIGEGFSYVMRYSWLWVTITVFSLGNVAIAGPLVVALPKLVKDVYRQEVWLLGVVQTSVALGSIVGSLFIGQMKQPRRRGLLAYLGVAFSGIGIVLLGLPFDRTIAPAIAVIGAFLFGAGEGAFSVIWVTVLQELVPADKQGRVFSIDALGSFCLLPPGYALVGVLTDRIGPAQVFVLGGLIALILVGVALSVRGVRELD